ncbi:MAG: decaprenyl-phosphate phosphoribosyltransferase [candidate division KSB1 bacterium]|nr:decaprenyl-phosphate phosphoribosyltransferase [candidate division KSB1 bacterium]MDZ7413868.1 decaprenyl-phosphate phosphoribosyltransferase [candidate division KSB1 bacterium]
MSAQRLTTVTPVQPRVRTWSRGTASALLVAIRPRQWSKNLLLFAGVMFSLNLGSAPLLMRACLAFAVFCFLSSAVYLFNDVIDADQDRRHPHKRSRPVASGRLSPTLALATAGVMSTVGITGAILLGGRFAGIAIGYFVLMNLYSAFLKRVAPLDVLVIAVGFVLRAVAGAVVVDVAISQWLVVCTTFLALFVALCKRRHELTALGADATAHRQSLTSYSPALLDQFIILAATSAVMSYTLYTLSPRTVAEFGHANLVYTVPLVVFGIFRYLYLVHLQNGGGNPEVLLFGDPPLLVSIVSWAVMAAALIYWI